MSTHLHPSIARAAALATQAHEGQTRDDGGGPYIKHPERVAGSVFISPTVALAPSHPARGVHSFTEPLDTTEGWAKYNQHYWRKNYRDFLEFFFSQMFTEPHSTKQIEDCVGWGLETSPDALIASATSPGRPNEQRTLELCSRVHCPVLVVHGDQDAISPHTRGVSLACATKGTLVTLDHPVE